MSAQSDIGQAIALAARSINQSQTLAETLQAITDAATHSVPGFDQVGISTLRKDGTAETQAATGELVGELDRIQYTLSEGPCVDSLRDNDVVMAPRLGDDPRWPRFAKEAVSLGVQSQMAIKLYLDGEGTIGGLNLYSTTSEDIDPEAEPAAELFAAHAAIALGNAKNRQQLNEALDSRRLIGQALGILMERYQMTEDRAFAFLVRASSHGNVKLRDVAEELVRERNGEAD